MNLSAKKWRFKLRSIFLAVSFVVLILPLGGVYFLRIYENELVKQTELELISQAAFIAAAYKREVAMLAGDLKGRDYGIRVNVPPQEDDYFTPVGARLDIRTAEIKPRPQEAQKTDLRADRMALEAGSRLTPLLLEAQRTTLSGVRILDHQGVVIGGRADIGLSFAHLEEVQRAKTGQYASLIRERAIHRPERAFASISRGTGIRVFVAFPILADNRLVGVVLLSRTPQSILEHLYNQKEKVFVLAAIVLVLAAALVIFTSYAVARPLHNLIQQTKRFAKGEKDAMEPLKSPITEEVALLSESFAEMARALESRAEYIRNFAAQVSHEFKTPLTAIRGAVELLQEHEDDMSPDQRARFLRNVAEDTDRLQRLTDRLLEMAGTGIRVFVAFPILADNRLVGVVLLSRTPQSILEHLYNQKEKVFVLAAIVLVLAAALVIFTSYAVARPLHNLIQQTKRFAKGEKDAMEPLKSPITEEVALLSESFAEMARALESRAEYIRNFAAQVSHEFKTPLTAIRGAVELLQEHEDDMSPDQRARFLRNVAEDTDRLQRLTDRLLEMARADVIAPTTGTTELKLALDNLAGRYEQQNLQVSIRNADGMTAAIAPEIFETVLTNLLDNSRQNGADRADITLSRADGEIDLLIADNGSGISSANAQRIFASFFTTRRDQGGTGLGLAIAQALLRAYKGKISLEPAARGATFRVRLPEAPG